jgi:enterochelin esterase-like enzyme
MLAMLSSCGCTKSPEPVQEDPEENKQEQGQDDGQDGKDQPDDKPDTNPDRYQRDLVLSSTILDTDIRYSVLLPKDYFENDDRRYPVVYMLHGYGDNQNSWNGEWLHARDRISALESAGLQDMIYVYPMGYQCYYVNRYDGSFSYMDMFARELVPHIDATLRTIPDRQHRSITGYSMGGFGAYVIAAKHPELFLCSAPLSMSFRTDQQYMTESASGWNNQWGTNFGGKGEKGEARLTDYYKEHCPYYVFNEENRQALETVKWYFTCGDDEEQLLIANDSLHVILRDRNFTHEYRVNNGAHTSKYWMDALNEVLTMFSFYMDGGDVWPGRNINEPRIPEISTDQNGVYQSEGFGENGTLVLVAYKGIDNIKDVMAELSRGSGYYALLPCNLGAKSLSEWKESWQTIFSGAKLQIVAIGEAGKDAMALQEEAQSLYFIDASLGEDIKPVKTCRYVILNTDNGLNYRDMGALYTACKRADASFEYRVAKATEDSGEDILRLIETNKTLFNF